MLKKAKKGMPEAVHEMERFEIPKVKGHIQGNRTVISNFLQIAAVLRRKPEHVLKFILKELATPGELKKSGSLMFGSKVSASRINEKIRKYAEEFVLCSECGKPDTTLAVEEGVTFMRCTACGAKSYVKSRM